MEELFYCACRGGWPRCLALNSRDGKLEIARDYYRQIYTKDVSAYDGVKRNQEWMKTLIWSYARNISTTAKTVILILYFAVNKEKKYVSMDLCPSDGVKYIFDLSKDFDMYIKLNSCPQLDGEDYCCRIDKSVTDPNVIMSAINS